MTEASRVSIQIAVDRVTRDELLRRRKSGERCYNATLRRLLKLPPWTAKAGRPKKAKVG